MKTVALDLSKQLRDPDGPHKCDIIVALTHSRSVLCLFPRGPTDTGLGYRT